MIIGNPVPVTVVKPSYGSFKAKIHQIDTFPKVHLKREYVLLYDLDINYIAGINIWLS